MFGNKKRQVKYRIPYATRFEFVLCAALACINIIALAAVCEFWNISAVIPAVIFTFVYLIELSIVEYNHKSYQKVIPRKSIHRLLCEDGSIIIKTE